MAGDALPDAALTWRDWTGALIPFAADGYTFEMKIADEPGGTALLTKTAGISGADADPNVTVVWATAAEITTLPAGQYVVRIRATRPDGKKRSFRMLPLIIHPGIA
jgi:hypothetical protein